MLFDEGGSCIVFRMRSERHRFFTDIELQLLLKQGQVEVDAHGFIRDYRHCVLIHRRVIEELNLQIKATIWVNLLQLDVYEYRIFRIL